jgi:hypothetical protein
MSNRPLCDILLTRWCSMCHSFTVIIQFIVNIFVVFDVCVIIVRISCPCLVWHKTCFSMLWDDDKHVDHYDGRSSICLNEIHCERYEIDNHVLNMFVKNNDEHWHMWHHRVSFVTHVIWHFYLQREHVEQQGLIVDRRHHMYIRHGIHVRLTTNSNVNMDRLSTRACCWQQAYRRCSFDVSFRNVNIRSLLIDRLVRLPHW